MPVTITEIVFRGAVSGTGPKKPEAETNSTERQVNRDQLIEDTVAEVMRLLDRQGQR
ncbi:MAG: DUF5908 family protein [Rhodobacter sp.]|nr:DUF5908 family protein [Rhodobacter sp.]